MKINNRLVQTHPLRFGYFIYPRGIKKYYYIEELNKENIMKVKKAILPIRKSFLRPAIFKNIKKYG